MQRISPSSQLLNPYAITEITNSVFTFRTNQDINYYINFIDLIDYVSPIIGIYDIKMREMQFMPDNLEIKLSDERIRDTLLTSVTNYFNESDKILTYTCDPSDGKAAARQILFSRWIKTMPDIVNTPLQIDIEHPNYNETIYGGVMRRSDFPFKDVLKTEFFDKVKAIVRGKY